MLEFHRYCVTLAGLGAITRCCAFYAYKFALLMSGSDGGELVNEIALCA